MTAYKVKIYNKLVEVGEAGRFRPVRYDKRDMLAAEVGIFPSTVLVWEENASFSQAIRNRMSRKQDRTSWNWRLFLEFSCEVLCEDFEEQLCDSPILIPRDGKLRQVTLTLTGADYEHPPRKGEVRGSNVLYSFEAEIGPR